MQLPISVSDRLIYEYDQFETWHCAVAHNIHFRYNKSDGSLYLIVLRSEKIRKRNRKSSRIKKKLEKYKKNNVRDEIGHGRR